MTLVFLATDNRTLVTRHADHVYIGATDDEDEQATFYEAIYFFLDGGTLVVATSAYARQRYGMFLGAIVDGTDPEQLREMADRAALDSLNGLRARN